MTDSLHLRVTVLEHWELIPFDLPASTTLGDLKRMALEAATVTEPASTFILKFRGAKLRDESRTLADIGLPDNAALIVLRERRFALR